MFCYENIPCRSGHQRLEPGTREPLRQSHFMGCSLYLESSSFGLGLSTTHSSCDLCHLPREASPSHQLISLTGSYPSVLAGLVKPSKKTEKGDLFWRTVPGCEQGGKTQLLHTMAHGMMGRVKVGFGPACPLSLCSFVQCTNCTQWLSQSFYYMLSEKPYLFFSLLTEVVALLGFQDYLRNVSLASS